MPLSRIASRIRFIEVKFPYILLEEEKSYTTGHTLTQVLISFYFIWCFVVFKYIQLIILRIKDSYSSSI